MNQVLKFHVYFFGFSWGASCLAFGDFSPLVGVVVIRGFMELYGPTAACPNLRVCFAVSFSSVSVVFILKTPLAHGHVSWRGLPWDWLALFRDDRVLLVLERQLLVLEIQRRLSRSIRCLYLGAIGRFLCLYSLFPALAGFFLLLLGELVSGCLRGRVHSRSLRIIMKPVLNFFREAR